MCNVRLPIVGRYLKSEVINGRILYAMRGYKWSYPYGNVTLPTVKPFT